MKKILLIPALILSGCAINPEPIPTFMTDKTERSIYATNQCRNVVRNISMISVGRTEFDAYYRDGNFKYVGTAKERFNFEKCLEDLGMKFIN
jgi:hypothetical protein